MPSPHIILGMRQHASDDVLHDCTQAVTGNALMVLVSVLAMDGDYFRFLIVFQMADPASSGADGFVQGAFYELLFLHDGSFLLSLPDKTHYTPMVGNFKKIYASPNLIHKFSINKITNNPDPFYKTFNSPHYHLIGWMLLHKSFSLLYKTI